MFKILSMKMVFVILIKLVLLLLFTSTFMDNVFINVLDHAHTADSYFSNNENFISYSFHSFILYLFFISSSIINFFGIESHVFINLIFKLPLLFADFLIFYILVRIFMFNRKNVYIYYFFNPIVLYAIYIDSYFTIIPTSLLMLSVYMLIRKKSIILSSLFLGLAIASDIHMVMVLPIILYLIYTKESRDETIKYMFVVLSLFLIVNFPYVLNGELVKMIRFSLQEYIGGTFLCIESFQIFNSLFVILLIYYYFFNQKQINTHLLYLYFGVLFTVPIFFKFPSPELYVYMVPYWAIYFIDHDNQKKSLFFYLFFSVVYLTFFLFFAEYDGYVIKVLDLSFDFKVLNETVRNILYTFLEVMIVIIVIAYKYSIAKNSLYRHATNLAIGIGGDSGVGKSLLLTNLTLIFRDKLLEIEGDGEHKWERGDERWNTFTHLDPKANYIHKQAEAISELKNHKVIYRSEYDHDTGKFTAPAKVKPKEIIVISGLHPFYLPKLRKIMDIKIYLDTDETLRRHWKILRDTSKRGYSKEKILKQISDREEDTQKYIYPQKKFADVIIRYFAINDFILGDDVEIQLGLKITFDASINVEGILEHLKADYTWDYNEDLKTQYIELKEQPTNNYTMLSQKSILNVDQIISSSSHWKHGYEGFIQFMLLLIISEKLKEEL